MCCVAWSSHYDTFIDLGVCSFFFFFNDTATTEIYTLSLHDALPIYDGSSGAAELSGSHAGLDAKLVNRVSRRKENDGDRKSTRLNSSHSQISYAVFCLKKKKQLHIDIKDNTNTLQHILRDLIIIKRY